MPEDLMGAILGEGAEGTVPREDNPQRVSMTFDLSRQVAAELEELWRELEADPRPSKSEIAEEALRIALEDVRRRGTQSELVERLSERHSVPDVGPTVRRSVDETGFIVQTTYDESGEIIDEDVVASVAELPVEREYVDERGRLVSLAKDELGNTFEQVFDEELNPLEARLVPGRDGL